MMALSILQTRCDHSYLHQCNQKTMQIILLTWWLMINFISCTDIVRSNSASQGVTFNAYVNITYKDPITGDLKTEHAESGRYGQSSRIDSEQGWLVHVRTADNKNHGCTPPVNIPTGRWIALIERGSCKFNEKISNAAITKNASAVVIYNNMDEDSLITMHHNVDDVVSIFLTKEDGMRIAELLDNDTKIWMQISVGSKQTADAMAGSINKTSVLFVSISFIVLMIISLAWLVFYYIQRFRYAHAKERLSKRLMHAAKKAISRMPMRTIKVGDKETESDYDPCAVCIDNYKPGDVVRILPCKHIFHKVCVDPWLIEQRSCPMCKLDILKAFGLQIYPSRESLVYVDIDGASTSMDPSDLMTANMSLRDDYHIIERVYYPYNIHLRVRLPETRSEAEETITGLEPAMPEGDSDGGVNISEIEESHESHALIPKNEDAEAYPVTSQVVCDGGDVVECIIEPVNKDHSDNSSGCTGILEGYNSSGQASQTEGVDDERKVNLIGSANANGDVSDKNQPNDSFTVEIDHNGSNNCMENLNNSENHSNHSCGGKSDNAEFVDEHYNNKSNAGNDFESNYNKSEMKHIDISLCDKLNSSAQKNDVSDV